MEVYYQPVAPQPFISKPGEFLSTKDAIQVLQKGKAVLLKPREYSLSPEMSKTAFAIVMWLTFLGGMIAFLAVSNDEAHIDHSRDSVTDYVITDYGRFDKFYLPKNTTCWIDHTKDRWVPNFFEGFKAMFLTFFISLISSYILANIPNLASRTWTAYANRPAIKKNNDIDNLKISTLCSRSFSEESPAGIELVQELVELDLMSDEMLKELNFSQTKSIKQIQLKPFTEMLEHEKFSQTICLRWKKLEKMLSASVDEVAKSLFNSGNDELFRTEPVFLETLIQELNHDQFTGNTQRLSTKIRSIDPSLSKLSEDEALEIVHLIHDLKCPLEEAYRMHSLTSYEGKDEIKEITLKLHNKGREPITISVPESLLCRSSTYFERMLKGSFKESSKNAIDLHDVDVENFKRLISFLKNGCFEEDVDFASLLPVAHEFAFSNALHEIESFFCKNLGPLSEVHEPRELLELCKDYELCSLQKAVALKLSNDSPSFFTESFLDILSMATEFSLTQTIDSLSEMICREMETLSQESTFIKRFTEIVKINHSLLEKIFPAFGNFLKEDKLDSKLLGSLWDEASRKRIDMILDQIISFCEPLENADIYLANWPVPPTRDQKTHILESLEIENYI